MDPIIDIDQELSSAMRVEPGADFAARVRTRIATDPQPIGLQIPTLALGAIGCAAVIAVIATVMTSGPDRPTSRQLLAARHDMPATTLRSEVEPVPAAITLPGTPIVRIAGRPFRGANTHSSNVIVSQSEMLALRRLLSGVTVMPPAPEPGSDEPSIPAISIDAIPVSSSSPGERQ